MTNPISVVIVLPLVERLISPSCIDPIPLLPMASLTWTWSLESIRTGLKVGVGFEGVEGFFLGGVLLGSDNLNPQTAFLAGRGHFWPLHIDVANRDDLVVDPLAAGRAFERVDEVAFSARSVDRRVSVAISVLIHPTGLLVVERAAVDAAVVGDKVED